MEISEKYAEQFNANVNATARLIATILVGAAEVWEQQEDALGSSMGDDKGVAVISAATTCGLALAIGQITGIDPNNARLAAANMIAESCKQMLVDAGIEFSPN
jgi:hypothetical protein